MVFSLSRFPRVLIVAALIGVGCSGGCGAGGCLTPYAAGTRYEGAKNDNAINIRLSPAGINYINSQWLTLVGAFAPGGTMQLPIGCTPGPTFSQNVLLCDFDFNTWIADQNGNRSCQAGEQALVNVTIAGMQLTPVAPDSLRVAATLRIDTGVLNISARGECGIISCSLTCAARYNNGQAGNVISAQVQFDIDTRFDRLLAFQVSSLDGTRVCGTSGAPAAPNCLNPDHLTIDSAGGACDFGCDVIGNTTIKRFVLQQLSGPLQNMVTQMVDQQSCAKCQTAADCPSRTDGSSTAVTCNGDGVCMSGGQCAPLFLGMQGTMNLDSLLGAFGAPPEASLELFVAAGATAQVDTGLSFGTRAGAARSELSSCVPGIAGPAVVAVPFPDFDGEATPPTNPGDPGYQFGLGVSGNFLNRALWAAHQSGAVCLAIGTEASGGFVNTGLFKTFLPSLGRLATRDGRDAPMLVVLRPGLPPEVQVGEGTYDPQTNRPIKPLLKLALRDLSIDFYALLDDRQVRLFTLTADIAVPMSLIFEGCDTVKPALGDLSMLITNVRTANSELLAEDPQVLADLMPTVIGLIEPALADGLAGFALPSLGTFKLRVREAKGVGRIGAGDAFHHLGLFADLMDANAACAVTAPRLEMSLKRAVMPRAEEMVATGRGLPWPAAVLDVRVLGLSGSPQFSYRVDAGLWTDFVAAPGGELTVTHPRLTLQGTHTIAVRARLAETPHGISAPRELEFVVDYAPPEVTLSIDRDGDRVRVAAWDVVSKDRLGFAYQVGDGPVSDFGPPREIAFSAVEQQGGVTVLVRDESGLVGRASWHPATVALRETGSDPAAGATPPAGCSTSGLGALGLLAVTLLRRRRG